MTTHSCHHSGTHTEGHEEAVSVGMDDPGVLLEESGFRWVFKSTQDSGEHEREQV